MISVFFLAARDEISARYFVPKIIDNPFVLPGHTYEWAYTVIQIISLADKAGKSVVSLDRFICLSIGSVVFRCISLRKRIKKTVCHLHTSWGKSQ
jgi:hypothetical protein